MLHSILHKMRKAALATCECMCVNPSGRHFLSRAQCKRRQQYMRARTLARRARRLLEAAEPGTDPSAHLLTCGVATAQAAAIGVHPPPHSGGGLSIPGRAHQAARDPPEPHRQGAPQT
jgi:hypothetical protein